MSRLAPFRRRPVWVALLLAGGCLLFFKALSEKPDLPRRNSDAYKKYVAAFQLAVAALENGPPPARLDPATDESGHYHDFVRAKFTEAIETIPQEPAAWANRGLSFLRDRRLDEAEADLRQAERLAPDSAEVQKLLGLLDAKKGRYGEAAARYRKLLDRNRDDLRALYTLVMALDQEDEPNNTEMLKRLDAGLAQRPNNLCLLHHKGLVAVRLTSRDALNEVVAAYTRLAPGWSGPAAEDARHALDQLKAEVRGPLTDEINFTLAILRNRLQAEDGYLADARELGLLDDLHEGRPVEQFLRLEPMRSVPAPADLGLKFEPASSPGQVANAVAGKRWDVVLPVWLTKDDNPAVFVADGREVRQSFGSTAALPFPGGEKTVAPTAHGVLAIDWNNDFRADLLFAGAGGLRFFQQGEDGRFTNVTAAAGLDQATLTADYFGAWPANVVPGSNLGFILAPRTGSPVVLSKNSEAAPKVTKPFPSVQGARACVWADFGRDGVATAAFLDAAGALHVFANEWHGYFRERALPEGLGGALALAAADLTGSGVFDLIALCDDGAILRLSEKKTGNGWDVHELARWADFRGGLEPGSFRLLVADLDNNGALDLIATGPPGTRVWLGDEAGRFAAWRHPLPEQVFAAVDLTQDGRLDLLGLSEDGQPVSRINRGKKGYHWQTFMPRCRDQLGRRGRPDNYFNSFGVGGRVDIHTGPVMLRQPMLGPVVHFGLGEQSRIAVARFQWPDGAAHAEYGLQADRTVDVRQRLAGW
jgi:tetratricopeptide (TPR) repeat protein